MILEPIRPHELGQVLGLVLPGIKDVLAQTRGEFTEESILAGVASARYRLWVGVDGETYLGHAITEINCYPTGRQLTILQAHSVPGAAKNILKDGMEVLEAEAIACGCRWVAVYSRLKHNRAGVEWADRMKLLGLEPSYTEYVKEV